MFFLFEFWGRFAAAQLIAREKAGEQLTRKAITSLLSPSLIEKLRILAPPGAGLKDQIKIGKTPGRLDIRGVLNCRLCEAARFNELARQFGPTLIIPTVTARVTLLFDWNKLKDLDHDYVMVLKAEIMDDLGKLRGLSLEREMTELKLSCPHFGAAD